jgi:4-amino-4-deoxy-L-arabinose transferase-like glycosyltransferase
MAVLLPFLLVAFMECRWRLEWRQRWLPLVGAFVLGGVPIAAWAIARWQVDQWTFFRLIFFQDFVALAATPLDNQSGTPLFYLNILQKHQYEWILAAAIVVILFRPASWAGVMKSVVFWRSTTDRSALIGAWCVLALAVPTLMQTKMPWYLNPFYPMFALGVGWVLSYGISEARKGTGKRRRVLVAVIAGALLVAELKLTYYSYAHRALARSAQGILMLEADHLRGATVYRTSWNHADAFVLKAIVGAAPAQSVDLEDFEHRGKPGDYFLASPSPASHNVKGCDLVEVRATRRHVLLQKRSPQPRTRCAKPS